MELNKHILLVMKWLDDPKSVSKDELVENKQGYIDAIEADKKPKELESKEWDGSGSKAGKRVRASVVGNDKWGECLVKFCDKDSDIVVVRFDSHSDDTAIRLPCRFLPIKTEKEKEREAFIDSAVEVMNGSLDDSQVGWAAALFDAGFKAPEGE